MRVVHLKVQDVLLIRSTRNNFQTFVAAKIAGSIQSFDATDELLVERNRMWTKFV